MRIARRPHRTGLAVAAALAVAAVAAVPALASPAVAEDTPIFGSDWDDPRTADQPIARPDTDSCTVRIVDNEFRSFDTYRRDYAPPADCAGDWSKVVLTLHGAVAGRQYDRLGQIRLGGVPIFKTSTPEPSADGIEWTVEKDLTSYTDLLSRPGEVEMDLGNVVNDTYTGVLDVQVDLTFYTTSAKWPAPSRNPETVQALDAVTTGGGATTGSLTVPANTEKLVAEVYATGSGGGCEEFWYTAAPTTSPDDYWCKAEQDPWREVQVYVDGELAGIATPYPHIYTGGWSNPFLWYVLPAPRAFDIKPLEVDLTPFVGTLTDGAAHEISVRVHGAEGDGWNAPVGLLSWQDEGSTRVTGAVTATTDTAPQVTNTTGTDGDMFTAHVDGSHSLSVTGYADTSHGRVTTTVERTVTETAQHRWSDGEYDDGEDLTFTDTGYVRTKTGSRAAEFDRWDYAYDLDGLIEITEAGDITTTMTLVDHGKEIARTGSQQGPWTDWSNRYEGSATWNYLVPREQRRSTGRSEHDFSTRSDRGCWHRVISTEAGLITGDRTGC
ncbi:peptide-N4-asparagine amidase [Nocardioides sp. NPDC126508]